MRGRGALQAGRRGAFRRPPARGCAGLAGAPPAGRRSCRYSRWSDWSLKMTLSPPSSRAEGDVHAAAVLVHERARAHARGRDVGDLAVRRPPDDHVAAVLQRAQFHPVQALAHALRPHDAHAAFGDELRGDGRAPGTVGRDGALPSRPSTPRMHQCVRRSSSTSYPHRRRRGGSGVPPRLRVARAAGGITWPGTHLRGARRSAAQRPRGSWSQDAGWRERPQPHTCSNAVCARSPSSRDGGDAPRRFARR